jgi:L-ascorbate metabolism protein UlaG (beta-lactamase superfamily)
MNITWYGQSCFKLQYNINDEEVVVIIDPYSESIGNKLPSFSADLLLQAYNCGDKESMKAVSFKDIQNGFVINSPGEYEAKNVFVQAINLRTKADGEEDYSLKNLFKIEAEGISIGHLGDIFDSLTSEQLDLLENVDILFVPVGGHDVLAAAKAVKIINQIEPKIVIPMYYKLDKLNTDLDSVDGFLKEMGLSDLKEEDNFKITKSHLQSEGLTVIRLKALVK